MENSDQATAQAFATSWNNLPAGSIYTPAQFADWMAPLTRDDIRDRDVLELGCGNGSLLLHCAEWQPRRLVGVDLGASVETARRNLAEYANTEIVQADLVSFTSTGYDVVYCIGVLHHLVQPSSGFASVLANTRPNGNFHCWVYAKEGNALIIALVEPIRKIASKLPWWITKHLIATPLVVPYYLYAKSLSLAHRLFPRAAAQWLRALPLWEYSLWIAQRGFSFFRHVAFDQLVTPRTTYLSRQQVQAWLDDPKIVPGSTYIIWRNGNSWKFGGQRSDAEGTVGQ